MNPKPIIPPSAAVKRGAVFMSGAGSNAMALLEYCSQTPGCGFAVDMIFTDRTDGCCANEIGERFSVPVFSCDIREFYRRRGETSIRLDSARRRELRAEWTNEVRRLLKPRRIDFVMLAGFIPLCNIAGDYPTLNVHPGNLLIEENGRRILAGLHYIPVETAILRRMGKLRSSVILAQPFSGAGNEMDSGPVLGVSEALKIDLLGHTEEELEQLQAARTPGSNCRDALRKVAEHNIERLKNFGDHVVFPRVADCLSRGDYALDADGKLYFRNEAVRTVEFTREAFKPVRTSE